MENQRRFGIALRTLRKQRGLTHEQMAELIERSIDTISKLERGVTQPSFETLLRVSKKLEIPLESLTEYLDADRFRDTRRIELEATMAELVRRLPTADLELAVDQIQAISRRATNRR